MPLPRTLDLDLLRSFAAVARLRSFSRAAQMLLRGQSTISLQIQRLEDLLGQRLFERSPRAVRLTLAGEMFLVDAERMLAMNDDMLARAAEANVEGRVRLGTPEDFATTHLQDVLARFAGAHPGVVLEVTCDLTLNLLAAHREGLFDLVLIKREPRPRQSGPAEANSGGVQVWREPLVWVGATPASEGDVPIALAVSPEPCVYRKRATTALEGAGRSYRIAYTCASLAGTLAAVRAGLGVTVLPQGMVPNGLAPIRQGLPRLADTEIALLERSDLAPPGLLLRAHIIRALDPASARVG